MYRNAFTGLGVLAFIGGVYFYSIQAVKQEDFVSGPCPPGSSNASMNADNMVRSVYHRLI